jgi:hypothetical protein
VSTPGQPTLPVLIVAIICEAGRPLTATQLAEEAQRRGFQSRSGDLARLMETRIQELKKKGIVRRAANQPGYTLAQATKGIALKTEPKKPAGPGATPKIPAKPVASAKPAASSRATKQPLLRVVLTQILKKSGRSMTGSELADAAGPTVRCAQGKITREESGGAAPAVRISAPQPIFIVSGCRKAAC